MFQVRTFVQKKMNQWSKINKSQKYSCSTLIQINHSSSQNTHCQDLEHNIHYVVTDWCFLSFRDYENCSNSKEMPHHDIGVWVESNIGHCWRLKSTMPTQNICFTFYSTLDQSQSISCVFNETLWCNVYKYPRVLPAKPNTLWNCKCCNY